MKLATPVLVPALALSIAACGSAAKPSTETSGGSGDAPAKQTTSETGTAPAKTSPADGAGSGGGAGSGTKTNGKTAPKPQTKPSGSDNFGLPNVSAYQVSANSAYPTAGIVAAGARFQLIFTSADGRPHLVKVTTPTPRTLKVSGKGAARVTFPAVRPGNYSLDVDGRRAVATLSVMDPKRFGKRP